MFSEPLVPIATASAEENRALAAAIMTQTSSSWSGVDVFEAFLTRFPVSAWRPSLLANMGAVYLRAGRPAKALASWDAAWQATRYETVPLSKAVADFALGNWLKLSTNMGLVDSLVARLKEIEGRDIGGSAASKVQAAREGLWILQNQHDMAAGSGPLALNAILRSREGGSYTAPRELTDYHARPEGASLSEVPALASRVGLQFQMAARTGDVPVPVPSVVHFTVDHYSAIVEARGGQYRLRDLIFGGDAWITREALLQESSGYFLIPEGALGAGWRSVTDTEGTAVIGHCAPGYPDDEDPGTTGTLGGDGGNGGDPEGGEGGDSNGGAGGGGDQSGTGGAGGSPPGGGCPPGTGMPVYSFVPNKASLRLADIPVGCYPPKGPSTAFRLTYDHREGVQPQIFSFWNTGPKWTLDWMSFVMDEPSNPSAPKWVYLRGGGREQFGTNPHWRSAASLVQISTSPIRYERRLRNGRVEVFAQSDGATGGYRRVFLTKIIDPKGQSLEFTYDANLRLVAATDALGHVTILAYELPTDTLKVTSVTDPFGRRAQFTYTSSGRLASITDVINLTSSFSYGPDDFIAAMTTPYGTTTFRHEPNASSSASYRMIEATDPLGGTERLEFHWTHGSVDASAPTNQVPTGFSGFNNTLQRYNSFYWTKRAWAFYPGDVTKATMLHWLITPLSDPFAYHGASSGIPHSVKRPLENRVWYMYPGQSTDGSGGVGTWSQPVKTARVVDDGSSQIWQNTYNANGIVTSETDPLGRQTSYTYATNGIDLLEVRQTGAVNHLLATYANYTAQHLPQSFTDAAGNTYTYTYNSAGQLLTVTNPLLETTTNVYDPDGYLLSVTGAVTGSTTTFGYNDYGRVDLVTNPDGYAVAVEYDALDRPTRVTYPDTSYEAITYDKLDAVSHRDRLGRVTRTFYDALRRVTSVRDPLGRTITQQWCGCGSLDKLIDAKGQSTTWERDVQSRVTREVRADGTTDMLYTYETTIGRLRTVTDPKDQVTTYQYAADDQILSVTYTNAAVPTATVSFTYDPSYPRLATRVDGTGATSYTYKAVGTLGALKVASIDGPLTDDTIAFNYDDLGRVVSRLVNGYGVSSRTYDALGRFRTEQNVLGTFTYGYDGLSNRLASAVYPNGQTSTYTYFGNTGDRLLQTIHHQTASSVTLSKFDYTYNAVGTIVSWRQQGGSSAVMWQYGYDAADELSTAIKKSTDPTPVVLKRYAYSYDTAGNRAVEQIDDAVTGASHDGLNRLVSQQPSGALRVAGTLNEAATVTIQGKPVTVTADNKFEGTAVIASGTNTFSVEAKDPNLNVRTNTYEVQSTGPTKSFTYDANGNLTADGTRTFEWDARNQLVSVTVGTHRSEFTYDGLRRRVRIVEKDNGSTTSDLRFVWCDLNICEERDAVGSGVTKRFYGQGVLEIGLVPLLDLKLFYTRDHLGSVRELTDSATLVRARYEYDSYGRQTKVTGDKDAVFGFTGHYQQTQSGLTLAPFRAYDANLGRWISEDPIGFLGGRNWYRYVESQPGTFADPLGLCASPPTPDRVKCELMAPSGYYSKGPGSPDVRFQKEMADAVGRAFENLKRQGIVPMVTSGFRTAADQARMKAGASGPNPAADVSHHQTGLAIDVNTNDPNFGAIKSALTSEGLTWGGTWRRPDRPHFQLPPGGTRPNPAMLEACGGL